MWVENSLVGLLFLIGFVLLVMLLPRGNPNHTANDISRICVSGYLYQKSNGDVLTLVRPSYNGNLTISCKEERNDN